MWFALLVFADPPRSVVEDAVSDVYRPLAFDQEKLGGVLAKRMRANSEGFLERADDQVSLRSGLASGDAETATSASLGGQFLEAAANAYLYRRDEHLKAVMVRAAKQVIESQSSPSRWADLNADTTTTRSALLEHKYDISGLLAEFKATGDEDALVAARKIGDRLLKMFPSDGKQSVLAIPLIEPLVALYRYTEENRYLEICKSAAEELLKAKRFESEPTANALSDMQGLIDLYRVTGDDAYFHPVREAWSKFRKETVSIAGNPAQAGLDGNCSTLAWMRLTLNLLRITGDAGFAEQLEQTTYNQLFASQDGNTGAVYSAAPLNGSKQLAGISDTCMSSEAEALTLVPAAVWGHYGNGIAVLLYNAGRANFQLSRHRGQVQLYSEASFPDNGDFLLHVEPAHNIHFPLRLRVPDWTGSFTADIAGSHLVGKAGTYLTINREWKKGDTIKISMDVTVRVLNGPPAYPDQIALQRGPQLLALPKLLNPKLGDLAEAGLPTENTSPIKLTALSTALPSSWPGDQAYTVAGEYQGQAQQLVLAPFADAKVYRVWLRRAKAASASIE